MNNSHPLPYTVLHQRNFSSFASKVTCFALNYVTHRIMLCNKDDIYLYDIERQTKVGHLSYRKKFEKIYDSEVKIKSVDAIIMSGLWVTFVNRKSFLFFNDKLEFSKIYSAEPNPALVLRVLQRTNDIITLRGDRKLLKVWKFELIENIENENNFQGNENEDDQETKAGKAPTAFDCFKKELKTNIDLAKHRTLTDKGQSFEMKLYTRKNVQINPNRLIINFVFSEELNLLIISLDNMEILFYSLLSCEYIKTLSFTSPAAALEKDQYSVPSISVEQELLYYCDDRRFVIYDLILDEEVINFPHLLPTRIVAIHAEKSNPNGGVYLFSADERLHLYSYSESTKIMRCLSNAF